jgi:hypothetical protein
MRSTDVHRTLRRLHAKERTRLQVLMARADGRRRVAAG